MFVERKVHYSALFINLVSWHAGAVSFPPSDVILAQLAPPPLNYIVFVPGIFFRLVCIIAHKVTSDCHYKVQLFSSLMPYLCTSN
jgi:hypothetical protein